MAEYVEEEEGTASIVEGSILASLEEAAAIVTNPFSPFAASSTNLWMLSTHPSSLGWP